MKYLFSFCLFFIMVVSIVGCKAGVDTEPIEEDYDTPYTGNGLFTDYLPSTSNTSSDFEETDVFTEVVLPDLITETDFSSYSTYATERLSMK